MKLKNLLIALGVTMSLVTVVAPSAHAVNVFDQCKTDNSSEICQSKGDDASRMIKDVINLLLYILGIIAVIMIVIGGIRFTTSSGNAGQQKEARETVIYSAVGLVVALLSFAIVNVVLDAF